MKYIHKQTNQSIVTGPTYKYENIILSILTIKHLLWSENYDF